MESGKRTCSIQLHGNYSKNLIISSRQNQFMQENIFNITPTRKIAVAINTNSAVAGPFHKNPFSYQQLILRDLELFGLEEHFYIRYNFSLSPLYYNSESIAF